MEHDDPHAALGGGLESNAHWLREDSNPDELVVSADAHASGVRVAAGLPSLQPRVVQLTVNDLVDRKPASEADLALGKELAERWRTAVERNRKADSERGLGDIGN
ncbi:hypothetical protein IPG36_02955 [bacterium]|nr:MAG: hypothetical protein IPG36_02955 [bacterium]